MTRRLQGASIRRKLIALTLTVILIPVFCVLAIVGEKEIRDIQTDMLASSALMGSMVAEFGAAALAFDNPRAAEQVLRTLGNHEEFLDAVLYDLAGHRFAAYNRVGNIGAPIDLVPPAPEALVTRDGARITVVRPVDRNGTRFGTIVLHTSTAPLTSRVRAYLWGLVWLIAGVLAASLMLAWALEQMVSRRVQKLADVAQQIAQREDYSVRADDRGRDEIALLAHGFNAMLAEIGRRQSEAQQAIRVRDEFLSVASHELKTPLTSLKLQVQSLMEMPPAIADPAEAKRLQSSFALTERQVRRLERLVTNLLDVSRIAIGRFALASQEVDLVVLVKDVIAQFSAEIQRGGYQVSFDLPAEAKGQWDPLRLEQVVVNLVSNAIKYGDGKPIDIAVARRQEQTVLRVRDHGIGVDLPSQERIFERFERAVSVNYGGLGLGLYITRQIVTAHGGKISVESTPGQGSTFVVELPPEVPASPASPAAPASPASRASSTSREGAA
ncbi:MAG: sensory box histidine kinase [Myxococcales bacterium]|nr:sensory box histidine kinase [Myxococcales bacterium]